MYRRAVRLEQRLAADLSESQTKTYCFDHLRAASLIAVQGTFLLSESPLRRRARLHGQDGKNHLLTLTIPLVYNVVLARY